jgi:hypothetical protein
MVIKLNLTGIPARLLRALASIFLFAAIFPSTLVANADTDSESLDANIQDFQLVSGSGGWLLSGQRLHWTDDNGDSWKDITPPFADHKIVDVHFMDDQAGWAVLEQNETVLFSLAMTNDNGRTWNRTSLDFPELTQTPSTVSAAYMGWRDAQLGWLVFKFATGSNFSLGLLYTTQDGGVTWQVHDIPLGEPAHFINAQMGWVAGGPAGKLFSTYDGGTSWQEQTFAGDAHYQLPVFSDEQNGILSVVSQDEDSLNTDFHRTDDGGQTWTLAGRAPLEADTSPDFSLPLSVMDAGTLVFIVPNSDRIVNMDAGEFSISQNADGLSSGVVALDMVSLENGWAKWTTGNCDVTSKLTGSLTCSRETRLLRTTDGGAHWESVPMPVTGQTSIKDSFSLQSKSGDAMQMGTLAFSDSDTQAYIGQGFDKCEIPTLSQMQNWWTSSPYNAVNLYIGGSARACSNAALNASFLSQLNTQGWRFIPTWVGPQASCSGYLSRMSSDPVTAHGQGVAEADKAVNVMVNLGLAEADGSGMIVYYDLEAYNTGNTTCRNAANAFISGWVAQMRARGNLGGVYGASCASAVTDWAGIENVPDAIWIANWYGNAGTVSYRKTASVWGAACLSDSLWSNHQRLRQYAGDHFETWGGITLGIDSNVLDGPLTIPNGRANQSAPNQPSILEPSNNATLSRTNDTWFSWKTTGDTCSIRIWGGSLDTTVNGNCSLYRLGVRPGGAYSWQVTATNGFGNTVGPVWKFNIRPHAPGALMATAASSTKVNLNWQLSSDDPANLDGYKIYTSGGVNVGSVNKGVSSFQVANLSCHTTHSFHVKAVRQGVESIASNTASATTPTCAPALASPAEGLVLENTRPQFEWQTVNEATGYDIQVSPYSNFSTLTINVRVNTTSYSMNKDLAVDKIHYWRVRSVGAFGRSDWSQVRSFKTANPPGIPKLLTPANNALTRNYAPKLDWSNSTLLTGIELSHYQIQVATDNLFTSKLYDGHVSISEFTVPVELAPNAKYFWRVRSFNTIGQYSTWSMVFSFRTALLPPQLTGPANEASLAFRRVTFDWEDVPGAGGYYVQASRTMGFGTLLVDRTSKVSNLALTSDLPAGILIHWRVRTTGSNGPSAWSPAWTVTTGRPPGIPSLLSPAHNALLTNYQPKLDWNNVAVPTGTTFDHYQIHVATDSGFTAMSLDQKVAVSEYTFSAPLEPNTKYFWRVRSLNTDGHYSSWSALRSFRAAMLAPANNQPEDNSIQTSLRPVFDWSDVTGATSYTIQISRYANFSTNLISANAVSSAYSPSSNLPKVVTLYWRVRANGPNGPSPWSQAYRFTIQP